MADADLKQQDGQDEKGQGDQGRQEWNPRNK